MANFHSVFLRFCWQLSDYAFNKFPQDEYARTLFSLWSQRASVHHHTSHIALLWTWSRCVLQPMRMKRQLCGLHTPQGTCDGKISALWLTGEILRDEGGKTGGQGEPKSLSTLAWPEANTWCNQVVSRSPGASLPSEHLHSVAAAPSMGSIHHCHGTGTHSLLLLFHILLGSGHYSFFTHHGNLWMLNYTQEGLSNTREAK